MTPVHQMPVAVESVVPQWEDIQTRYVRLGDRIQGSFCTSLFFIFLTILFIMPTPNDIPSWMWMIPATVAAITMGVFLISNRKLIPVRKEMDELDEVIRRNRQLHIDRANTMIMSLSEAIREHRADDAVGIMRQFHQFMETLRAASQQSPVYASTYSDDSYPGESFAKYDYHHFLWSWVCHSRKLNLSAEALARFHRFCLNEKDNFMQWGIQSVYGNTYPLWFVAEKTEISKWLNSDVQ